MSQRKIILYFLNLMGSSSQLCGIEIVTLYTAGCTILTKVNIVAILA